MNNLGFRKLDIDALRALRAIKQKGGVTRAAEALGLTQSAISHKIKRLETSLDCELLARKRNGHMFTATGKELLDYAERILGLHDEALLSLTRTSLSGRIRLGFTEDTTCSDIARILGRFHHLHPQVNVRTRVQMSLALGKMLEQQELDAAIMQIFEHDVRPTDTVLFREKLHWVRSEDFSLPEEGPVPFLAFGEDCFYRQWAQDVGQDAGEILETVFECSSVLGIVSGVMAGLGITLLGERHLSAGMTTISERFPKPPALAYVVRRAKRVRNPALDSLVNEIESQIVRSGGLALAV